MKCIPPFHQRVSSVTVTQHCATTFQCKARLLRITQNELRQTSHRLVEVFECHAFKVFLSVRNCEMCRHRSVLLLDGCSHSFYHRVYYNPVGSICFVIKVSTPPCQDWVLQLGMLLPARRQWVQRTPESFRLLEIWSLTSFGWRRLIFFMSCAGYHDRKWTLSYILRVVDRLEKRRRFCKECHGIVWGCKSEYCLDPFVMNIWSCRLVVAHEALFGKRNRW